MAPTPPGPVATHRRSGAAWSLALLGSSWAVPAAILVQAAIAGSAWFAAVGSFEVHGWIGSGVFVVAVLVAALAVVTRQRLVTSVSAVLVALGTIGQLGLGYVGHRGGLAVASAIHVPLGVALLGLAVVVAVLATVDDQAGHRGH